MVAVWGSGGRGLLHEGRVVGSQPAALHGVVLHGLGQASAQDVDALAQAAAAVAVLVAQGCALGLVGQLVAQEDRGVAAGEDGVVSSPGDQGAQVPGGTAVVGGLIVGRLLGQLRQPGGQGLDVGLAVVELALEQGVLEHVHGEVADARASPVQGGPADPLPRCGDDGGGDLLAGGVVSVHGGHAHAGVTAGDQGEARQHQLEDGAGAVLVADRGLLEQAAHDLLADLHGAAGHRLDELDAGLSAVRPGVGGLGVAHGPLGVQAVDHGRGVGGGAHRTRSLHQWCPGVPDGSLTSQTSRSGNESGSGSGSADRLDFQNLDRRRSA
ncbi:hypothetical protein C0212_08505 [Moraxella catarrhalis]|nr:hypothetical protein [Moraxella catarrhalis]